MDENKLIKVENNQLQKISNAIAITNKLLVSSDRKAIADLFCKYPTFFIETISWYYGLSHQLIYKYEHKWNFQLLSRNEAVIWSKDLIAKYKNRWQWEYGISYNKSIPWTSELIEEYYDKLNWTGLAKNKDLIENDWFKIKYSEKLESEMPISNSKREKVANEEVEEYINHFLWDTSILSSSPSLPWSEELLDKYINIWDWNTLSDSNWLPWSEKLIDKFVDKWNWENLSSNTSICWSEKVIEKYKTKWTWSTLFLNNSIQWTISMFDKYKGLFESYKKCNDFFWNIYIKNNVDDLSIVFILEKIS